jgi:hypothetical protein
MYKADYGNNIRRKGNSDTYKYMLEASEALAGARPWAVTSFAHPVRRHWTPYM